MPWWPKNQVPKLSRAELGQKMLSNTQHLKFSKPANKQQSQPKWAYVGYAQAYIVGHLGQKMLSNHQIYIQHLKFSKSVQKQQSQPKWALVGYARAYWVMPGHVQWVIWVGNNFYEAKSMKERHNSQERKAKDKIKKQWQRRRRRRRKKQELEFAED